MKSVVLVATSINSDITMASLPYFWQLHQLEASLLVASLFVMGVCIGLWLHLFLFH